MKIHQSISVIIPTLNNEGMLPGLISSIRQQKYPQNLIRILVCDGGSTDATREIAQNLHCSIINNPQKLADFGVYQGMLHAKGDLCLVMACDNRFSSCDAFRLLAAPFLDDKNIAVCYPKQVYTKVDHWITRYINTFTDPVNHFVYGNSANTRTFGRCYPVLRRMNTYVIYNFKGSDYPMIGLAQGTMFKNGLHRHESGSGDDIGPIKEWIDAGFDLAYVPAVELEHHTTNSLGQFRNKMKWSFQNFLTARNYGVKQRQKYFSLQRRLRMLFWPIYAVSLILPVLNAATHILATGNTEWVYHPLLTYVSIYVFIIEFIRIKILKHEIGTDRNT